MGLRKQKGGDQRINREWIFTYREGTCFACIAFFLACTANVYGSPCGKDFYSFSSLINITICSVSFFFLFEYRLVILGRS